MDINTTNNITFNVGDNNPVKPAKSDQPAITSRNNTVDAALQITHNQTIEKALAINLEDIDLQAIAQARHDMQSDQLDTAQNARTAAQNILKSGI